MSLEQETVEPESLKIHETSLDTLKTERSESEETYRREEKSVSSSSARSSEFVGEFISSEMPSIESGAWSDGEVMDKISCFEGTTIESLQAKKARVENIISTMQHIPTAMQHIPTAMQHIPTAMQHIPAAMQANGKETDSQRRKRKQYQPQPQREVEPESKKKPGSGNKKEEKRHLQTLLHHLQQQLDVLQERYQDLYDEESHSDSADSADLDDLNEPVDTSQAIRKSEMLNGKNMSHSKMSEKNIVITHDKAKQLRSYLKAKLSEALLNAVDSLVDNIIINPPPRVKKQPSEPPALHTNSKSTSPAPLLVPGPVSHISHHTAQSLFATHSPAHSEQTEALSLVVPSRKNPSPVIRNINKSPLSASCHITTPKPHALATSVAIPNPSLHHPFARSPFLPALSNGYDHLDDYRFMSSPLLGFSGMASQMSAMVMNESNHHASPRTTPPSIADSYSSFKSECSDSSPPMAPPDLSEYSGISGTNFTLTLTPTHLRKAKLMFFFCRYPSSAILRQYFPDVKFNRHNTSQMIKWFSNFREFFYIQMEKFSRQALSGGMAEPEALEVSRESELFRALNLHYNKSNEYRAPDSFINVATTTLREFFMAIQNGRDSEASWKKSIYKVISKLDEPIPSFFRSTNCLDLLQG